MGKIEGFMFYKIEGLQELEKSDSFKRKLEKFFQRNPKARLAQVRP